MIRSIKALLNAKSSNGYREGVGVAVLLGIGVLLSLWREIELARTLGTSEQLDIFRIAFSLPNFLSQTVGTAFIAAMIPLLVPFEQRNPDRFDAAFKTVFLVNVLIVASVTILGLATTRLQVQFLAPGFTGEMLGQTEAALRVCWLVFPLIGTTFALRARLNMNRVYWPGAMILVVRAAIFIAFILLAGSFFPSVVIDSKSLAFAALAGGAAVLAMHILGTPKVLLRRMVSSFRSPAAKELQITMVTIALGAAFTYQLLHGLPRFVDRAYASGLGTGVVSATEYGYSVVLVVALLLGTAFNTVFLPRLSRSYLGTSDVPLKNAFLKPLAAVVALSLGVGILGSIFAPEIVALVFERGAFGAEASAITTIVLKWQLLAAAPTVIGIILGQSLISMNVRKVLVLAMVIKVIIKVITMELLIDPMGVEGIGLSYFITESCVALILIFIFSMTLRKKRDAIG